jgi:uncharacterized membrane protein YqjE
MAMGQETRADRARGLLDSVQHLGNSLLSLILVRLELLSLEIAQERFNLAWVAVVVFVALFCLQSGVTLAVLFFVLAVPSGDRLAAIGVAAAVLLVGAAIAVLWLRRWLRTRPPLFAATMAELQKDRERLGGKP